MASRGLPVERAKAVREEHITPPSATAPAPIADAELQTAIAESSGFRWMDLLWLILIGVLAVLHPVFEIHKQLTLLAIGLFQIFDRRILVRVTPSRRNAYSVFIKILLATLLIAHTGTLAMESPYWLIYYVPVVSAATLYEARGTLLWTTVAGAAYCSYLYPTLMEYQLTQAGETEIALRLLFLYLAAVAVNRFVSESRRQAERYRDLAETLAETNRRMLEAQAQVRRSERLAALGQLSAGVAHEIRNPLGVIKGSAEMLAQKLPPSDGLAAELAGYIGTEVDRLNAIVSRFLDFARPLHPERLTTELPPLVDRALRTASESQANARVEVEREFEPDLPAVPADAALCEQVFTNLAINAYQAMGELGGTLWVRVRAVRSQIPSGVEIEFEDSGPGVPDALREQVFNPFFTTRKTGVGLGLAIVSKIIDEHGGSIRLESNAGKGACFRVFLPGV
jgi:two-component system, NtrC family, sensor histidine kinase HydH